MRKDAIFSSILITICMLYFTPTVRSESKSFNVKNYGAVGDGRTDCTKAFKSTWNDACKWKGKAQLIIPRGTYLVKQLMFEGPCKGPLGFQNSGIIKAHEDDSTSQPNFWIKFQYLDKLDIFGGGLFDGQVPQFWPKIIEDPSSGLLPISMVLNFVNNSRIDNMKFTNSKGTHIKLFGCNSIVINHLTIIAPRDSLNTDGINIAHSTQIQVSNSHISTGDDCVSVLPGSQDINITGISCGPGHGISIGSMGGEPNEGVERVSVRNCNFTNTLNGVRIKTWATTNVGVVSYISFENIFVHNSSNPIIIDQNYCPSHRCPKGDSHVEINNVKFKDIRGDSKSRVAVNFQCSKYKPCQVETRNIDLKYNGNEGPITSICVNAKVTASGCEKPPSCFAKNHF